MKKLGLTILLMVSGLLQVAAQDMRLSDILIEGEEWQLVAEGYQFTDASCVDEEGNFYFTDVARGTAIHKIGADGKVTNFIENAPRISGLKFGPDGILYACTQAPKKQIVAFGKDKQMRVLMEETSPNDLVVNKKAHVYFTHTDSGKVILVESAGKHRAVAEGINKPNGISLSPDGGTLAVSEFGGTNVWTYRVESDGSLAHGAPYMTLRTAPGKTQALGDGMTSDEAGRFYVSSELGIQVFDPTGRMIAVIPKPQPKFLASIGFGGTNREYLYALNQDKVFRRKTKAKGAIYFK